MTTPKIPEVVPCRGCGAPIRFKRTVGGKWTPINADGPHAGDPHWAHCKQADMFRRPKAVRA